ncbi:hypothetical protein HYH03_017736 [Edaphochlamys debaryana]|uniref:Uncharacterized protein n=1 Tax=Edaphochlamys debaryana TaxID=47281 RepID=A0A836BQ43_9CHLO|nr:hypothetical protein HYH03_017736 [Edaphochlamys debaryana]|eukprot:KAG2483384.1 hypothetical protein HYH03_017736 [Edaphochlamys debaryana]
MGGGPKLRPTSPQRGPYAPPVVEPSPGMALFSRFIKLVLDDPDASHDNYFRADLANDANIAVYCVMFGAREDATMTRVLVVLNDVMHLVMLHAPVLMLAAELAPLNLTCRELPSLLLRLPLMAVVLGSLRLTVVSAVLEEIQALPLSAERKRCARRMFVRAFGAAAAASSALPTTPQQDIEETTEVFYQAANASMDTDLAAGGQPELAPLMKAALRFYRTFIREINYRKLVIARNRVADAPAAAATATVTAFLTELCRQREAAWGKEAVRTAAAALGEQAQVLAALEAASGAATGTGGAKGLGTGAEGPGAAQHAPRAAAGVAGAGDGVGDVSPSAPVPAAPSLSAPPAPAPSAAAAGAPSEEEEEAAQQAPPAEEAAGAGDAGGDVSPDQLAEFTTSLVRALDQPDDWAASLHGLSFRMGPDGYGLQRLPASSTDRIASMASTLARLCNGGGARSLPGLPDPMATLRRFLAPGAVALEAYDFLERAQPVKVGLPLPPPPQREQPPPAPPPPQQQQQQQRQGQGQGPIQDRQAMGALRRRRQSVYQRMAAMKLQGSKDSN